MRLWQARIPRIRAFSVADIVLLALLVVGIYGLTIVARQWGGPFRPTTEISLDFASLGWYALLSLFRVFVAYALSLVFTLTYGYLAAKSRTLEPILLSLLDILQSVPVLGFMPGLVLSLVYIFPDSNIGLELAAVIMIFTGQAWNMVFSFYSSVKGVPQDWRDLASLFRLGRWDMLRKIELPYATNGLLWNSMLSVAGGWFFLMVIEQFSLGERNFRLPGIGSYMAVAYEQKDTGAIVAGVAVMFLLIIIVDRCIWSPLVVWSERFRLDAKPEEDGPRSVVLEWLKRSHLLDAWYEWRERIEKKREAREWDHRRRLRRVPVGRSGLPPQIRKGVGIAVGVVGLGAAAYGLWSMGDFIRQTPLEVWGHLIRETFLTLLRVVGAVVLGSLWTIPVGVFIGTNRKWTQRLQPVVQVVASFPVPMLFPPIAFGLIRLGIPLEAGAVILLLLSSQWYILFNVISGASVVPAQVLDLAKVFRVRGWRYWRSIMLPAIFPGLVNGWITAAGGAWNACIVAEWVQSGERTEVATGIGAAISRSAAAGNFPVLASAIIVMVVTVVLLNRVFWDNLYRLAETRYKPEY